MNINLHNARVRDWKKISKKERSERMRQMALKKWSKVSKRGRKAHSVLMVKARTRIKNVK